MCCTRTEIMFDVIKPKKIKIDEKYGKNCGKFRGKYGTVEKFDGEMDKIRKNWWKLRTARKNPGRKLLPKSHAAEIYFELCVLYNRIIVAALPFFMLSIRL